MLIYILSCFSDSYSTHKLHEVIKAKQHQVKIINHCNCEYRFGKQIEVWYENELLAIPNYIIPRIGFDSTIKGINLIKHYELLGVKTLTSVNGLLNSRNKFKSLQLFNLNGINTPKTYFTTGVCKLVNVIDTVGLPPFILKVLEGTQGNGVYLVSDIHMARTLIDDYTKMRVPFLIQEYIKEAKGNDVRAFVIGDRVVAAIKRVAKKDEFRSNIHKGGTAEKIILTTSEQKIAIKAAKAVGLTLAGVDILQTKKGPMVLEVNSSPGLEGIENYSGIEVAEEILSFIENN
jgi:ribosomal protein S6--L-glutamate ligase